MAWLQNVLPHQFISKKVKIVEAVYFANILNQSCFDIMSWTLFLLDIISPVVIKYKNFKIDLSVLLKWLIQIKLIVYGGHELVE